MYIVISILAIKCIAYLAHEKEHQRRHKKFIKNLNNYGKQRQQNKRDNKKS
jgi:uncharacterized protein YxeA